MVMAQELYALLTSNVFCLPNNPGKAVVYVCAALANQPVNTLPLMQTEQATINTQFAHTKHYFMLMHIVGQACFTALDVSINNAFKVLDNLAIRGWHASMHVINILDQLSKIYSQPTTAVLALNNAAFFSPYLAPDVPEALFCWIKDCAKIAFLR
jgi:hypothetical protein